MKQRTWSVGELIAAVNSLLKQGFSGIRVEGELTNVNASARGHVYFSLKDERAAVDCVMWAGNARRLKFDAEDGLAVSASGSLTVYAQRGRFQLVVDRLEPQGIGALQLAFEQLKAKLERDGLFEAERKRPLPALPNRVGIVTSETGAALQDMLKVLRRFPHLEVVLAPSRVQGDGAAEGIADALTRLSSSGLVDVVIVGRGGGSLEDLWCFNEEVVARAIADSEVPVISGVGHEVDSTISDFVADIRATTPTQAAEIIVARLEEQQRRIAEFTTALGRDLRRHLRFARARLEGLEGSSGLDRLPRRINELRARLHRADRLQPALRTRVETTRTRLESARRVLAAMPSRIATGHRRLVLEGLGRQMEHLMAARLDRLARRAEAAERALQHLSPNQVLQRGFSITRIDGAATPLRDPAAVKAGQSLVTTLAGGELRSLVAGSGPRRTRASAQPDQCSLFGDDPLPEPEKG